MIEVLDPGLLTTVQDLGRPGHGAIGVPPSGAVDRESLAAANALVGNELGAACLETTLTGLSVRLQSGGAIAVTGAPARVTVAGAEVPFGVAVEVKQGDVVTVGAALSGVRSYLAIAGGIEVEPVLGSRSTDLLTGLGPAPLDATVTLPVGVAAASGAREANPPLIPDDTVLRVMPGPRLDRFGPGALELLVAGEWSASPRSNRIGIRLEGAPLPLGEGVGSLRSEGLVTGALQVPPGGLPTLMLNDRPTTGGYPVIAVVVEADLRLAGQLRPGARFRFEVA